VGLRYARSSVTTAAEPTLPPLPAGTGSGSWVRRFSPTSRLWLYVLFAVGTLTFLPALLSPLVLDDYLHSAMVRGLFPAPRGPLDLYDFASDADRQILIDRGILPWWTHPQFTIRFFRPLSSLLLWADHRAFTGHPLFLHLPSFLYWAAAVLGAWRLFRRRLASRVAQLATVIFALGAWHAIPLCWLANCEALVTLALGVFALDAYLLFRQGGRRGQGVLAFVLFSAALLGGEYALCFGGYCLAAELVDRRGIARAVRTLVPFALPAAGYLLVRGWLHYGAFGTSFYADPLRDPALFLRLFPVRYAALLGDGWLTIPCDSWGFGDGRWAAPLLALLAALPLGYAIRTTLRWLPEDQQKTAKAWLLGSLLAAFPVATVVPAARLLGVSAIGIAAVVALVLEEAWWSERAATHEVPRQRAREVLGTVAVLVGFAQLVHGPATGWLAARQMRRTALDFIEHTAWLRERVTDPKNAQVMVIRAGGGMFFGPFAVDAEGEPPARWRTLSHTGHAMVLRKGLRALDLITPVTQSVYPGGDGNLFRSPERPLHVGDEVRVPGMRARVVAIGENGPTRVHFEFDEDTDAPDYVWTAEDALGFKSAELPRVGFGAPFDP
jgi:hypothetical protein